jgi:T-complex protein 1 subunit beta
MSAEGVMASNSEVHKGENARMSSFVGAIAIADLVKTTLGPKGMDKILQSVGDPNNMKITITNDGATILKSVPVDNPAAKVLVEIAKTQDDTVGDGTTSVAVLCGELLREAEFLVQVRGLDCLTSLRVFSLQPCLPIFLVFRWQQRVHPMTIMAGWRTAVAIARAALEKATVDHSSDAKVPFTRTRTCSTCCFARLGCISVHFWLELFRYFNRVTPHTNPPHQPLRHYGSLARPSGV